MNMVEIKSLRSDRVRVKGIDPPTPGKAALWFDLGYLIQAPDSEIDQAVTQFYVGMFDGKIKDEVL